MLLPYSGIIGRRVDAATPYAPVRTRLELNGIPPGLLRRRLFLGFLWGDYSGSGVGSVNEVMIRVTFGRSGGDTAGVYGWSSTGIPSSTLGLNSAADQTWQVPPFAVEHFPLASTGGAWPTSTDASRDIMFGQCLNTTLSEFSLVKMQPIPHVSNSSDIVAEFHHTNGYSNGFFQAFLGLRADAL